MYPVDDQQPAPLKYKRQQLSKKGTPSIMLVTMGPLAVHGPCPPLDVTRRDGSEASLNRWWSDAVGVWRVE